MRGLLDRQSALLGLGLWAGLIAVARAVALPFELGAPLLSRFDYRHDRTRGA